MTQRCSIPLIRCDYKSALKATDTHQKETESPKGSDIPSSLPTLPEQSEENTPVRMSGRTRTVINYKQFLEEYADAPPSPLKRRSEVDLRLKCRPSKERIASERYQSKFTTKPTNVPKPVHNKRPQNKTATTSEPPLALSTRQADSELEAPEVTPTNKTLLTPATSAKMRDAIDALLLLGELPPANQIPVDDNLILVPILGYNEPETSGEKSGSTLPPAPENVATSEAPIKDNQHPEMPADNDEAPAIQLPGTVLGTAIKTDVEAQTSTTDKADPKPTPVKKELSFKQYGIKRKYKQTHMFKCKLCPSEMPSVQEYNKHYLDCHPPQLCPDCT